MHYFIKTKYRKQNIGQSLVENFQLDAKQQIFVWLTKRKVKIV